MVQLSSCVRLTTTSRYVLSATPEINLWFGLFPFRSPLLRKSIFLSLPLGTQMFQFPRSTLLQLCIHYRIHGVNPCKFPHSEIFGSLAMCAYPKLIAAYHVLHRLLMPRHSPCALCSLTLRSSIRFYYCVSFVVQVLTYYKYAPRFLSSLPCTKSY